MSGDNNVAIGSSAGSDLQSGNGNIFIGTATSAPVLTGSNQLNIGNTIYGIRMGSPNNRIGIGINAPTENFHTNGTARISSLPTNGQGIYTQPSGAISTTGNRDQTFTATRMVIADANGVLGSNTSLGAANGFFWGLSGNSGTNAANNFIGTTDNQPLVFKAGVGNQGGRRVGFIGWAAAGNMNSIGLGALDSIDVNSGAANQSNAFGYRTLHGLIAGAGNNAFGSQALEKTKTGYYNTAVGGTTLQNSTGSSNTAIGYSAGWSLTAGDSNIFIGYNAQPPVTTGSNQLSIGNTIYGRNVGVANPQISINTTTPPANFTFWVNGLAGGTTSWSLSSDRRLKTNIADIGYGLQDVMKLKPVRYVYKNKPEEKRVGFIAQDLQTVVPEAVHGTEGDISKGEVLTVSYDDMIPILTKAIQEQQAVIEKQQAQIEALQKEMTELKNNAGKGKRVSILAKNP
jgi:uncharacterized coiled-coil protein SlyX